MSTRRALIVLSAVAILLGAGACGRRLSEETWLWSPGAAGSPLLGAYASGAVAVRGHDVWLAYVETVEAGAPRIRIVRLEGAVDRGVTRLPRFVERLRAHRAEPGGAPEHAPPPVMATFAGDSPGIVVLPNGRLVVAYVLRHAREGILVARRGSADGRSWSDPTPVSSRRGDVRVANGRLVQTVNGSLLLPAVWREIADSSRTTVVCYESHDGGGSWRESSPLPEGAGLADPAIAELADGRSLLVLRVGDRLARSVSSEGGRWTPLQPLGIATDARPPALARASGGNGLVLAWTDPAPDSTYAPPGLQALRIARSVDAGQSWQRGWPLAIRSGRVPAAPALAVSSERCIALFEDRHGEVARLICLSFDARQLDPARRLPAPEQSHDRYCLNRSAAAATLRVVCEHTLARSAPSLRLFIEGYYMRTLVAAHEVLSPLRREHPEWLDTREGLLRATSFADWMVTGQDGQGYWPLGYKALYVADMGVAAGLFAALEPHVDAARLSRYQAAAERFVGSLERDGMLLPSGACGVGWPESRVASPEARAVRDPYLVSTALTGIELHAWLYRRTHRPEYRRRALAALDYTLSQLAPDGSLPRYGDEDGPLATAAYVEEGWMAADALLPEPEVRDRLRRAMPAHVDWLLRSQGPDGTWTTGGDGEFARTPAIIDFLIWYDARCESRQDVRRAVQRASAVLLDPERWPAYGLFRTGKHQDVLRAIVGRPLAAMVGERFIL